MHIRKRSSRVPTPTDAAATSLAAELAPPGTEIPAWVIEAIIVAYQNGRYDEACEETRDL